MKATATLLALTFGLTLTAGTIASAQNLVTNPGFETGDFTGYTVTDAATYSELTVSTFRPNSGTYEAAFGAFGGEYDTISQTLPTTTGAIYDVSFDLANYNAFELNESFSAKFGSTTLLSLTDDPGSEIYTEYTAAVAATGSSTVLSFAGFNGASAYLLDDISVTAAPEPSTWALLGLGAAGLGLTLRRRASRA